MEKNTSKKFKLDDLKFVNQPNCKIKNKEKVEGKICGLIDAGIDRLQLVSDFDYTITKQRFDDGRKVLTSFEIFNACKSLPPEFLIETKKLYEIYRPIEIDPDIPIREKQKHMIEWWTQSIKLLKGFAVSQSEIDEVAYAYRNSLRDGTKDLFKNLNELNVPILVFSAGLGNSVKSLLRQAGVLFPNIKIISNFLKFKDEVLDGIIDDTMIHTFNKNETILKGTEYYDIVRNRDSVIVMGDSLGDAGMANGVPTSSNIIKIAFLYEHVDKNMEKYLDAFDIVLIDDQTMNAPQELVSLIAANKKSDQK